MSDVAQRVAAGAAWLDANVEGWLDSIDLDTLAMEMCEQCVLGQLFGDYFNADLMDDDFNLEYPATLGFDLLDCQLARSHDRRQWAELTNAWRELITARRAELDDDFS